jgi:hypothetical protein
MKTFFFNATMPALADMNLLLVAASMSKWRLSVNDESVQFGFNPKKDNTYDAKSRVHLIRLILA